MNDLSNLDVVKGSNEGTDIRLKHPSTNEDLGIIVHVLGRDSTAFRELADKQNKKRIARMTRGGVFRGQMLPTSEIERDALELLAACTVSWKTEAKYDEDGKTVVEVGKDSITFEGKEVDGAAGNPLLLENAKMLYTRLPWLREQVDTEVNDRANFIKS